MLAKMLKERGIMPVWPDQTIPWETRRKEIAELFCREEYGFMPREHDALTWEVEEMYEIFCAGRAELKKVRLTAHFGEDCFTFPIYTAIPKKEGKHPFFVQINFRDQVPDIYMPTEEICDRGFAVVSFGYNDVTVDEPTEKLQRDPLAEILWKGIEKQPCHAGKIRIWAWAASRALDYALTLDSLDPKRAAVIGHSRLGKTALVASMLDERFQLAIANNSGCSGAAISHGKNGEKIENITSVFPHWFCEKYKTYAGLDEQLPFDQHFLVAASAPRHVYVASAVEDYWADPNSEFLSCCGADEVYQKLGLTGFVCEDRLPTAFEKFQDGRIGYHIRMGDHYLGREDWNLYMDYMEKHF